MFCHFGDMIDRMSEGWRKKREETAIKGQRKNTLRYEKSCLAILEDVYHTCFR